jgi:hypothetical protein
MFDKFRTLLARFIVGHLSRPRLLAVHAWPWLANVGMRWMIRCGSRCWYVSIVRT